MIKGQPFPWKLENEVTTWCASFDHNYYDYHDYYYNNAWFSCQRLIEYNTTAYECNNRNCPVGRWEGTHVEAIWHGAIYCWDFPGGVICPWK